MTLSIRRRALALALTSVACFTCAPSPSALASAPTGDFSVFGECPRFGPPTWLFCMYTRTVGGAMAIGGMRVPIANPMTIQGAYFREEESIPVTETFVGSLDGNTLSKTRQPVPGGLLGILTPSSLPKPVRQILEGVLDQGSTSVTATTELARPADQIGISTDKIVNEEGVGLTLPVRVHLENPFLGGQCYIGSSAAPLLLKLTDATTAPPPPNKPITGRLGEVRFRDQFELMQVAGALLVDNAFSVSTANGCGGAYAPAIDSVMDAKLGLPSPAGRNAISMPATILDAPAEDVVASER